MEKKKKKSNVDELNDKDKRLTMKDPNEKRKSTKIIDDGSFNDDQIPESKELSSTGTDPSSALPTNCTTTPNVATIIEPINKKKQKKKPEIQIEPEGDELQKEIENKTKPNTKAKKKAETPIQSAKKKTKNKSKEKVKTFTDKEAHHMIFTMMKQHNRPFNVQQVVDMLKSQIKKTQCQKLMDQLLDEGQLIMKEYNGKIYLANQSLFPQVNEVEICEMDALIQNTNHILPTLKDRVEKIKKELDCVNHALSNEDLEKMINEHRSQIAVLGKRLKLLEERKIDPISEDKIKEVEETYNTYLTKYKTTKKISFNLIDNICDAMEMSRKQFIVRIMLNFRRI